MAATKQETRARTEKNTLMNPDPYHTPGYCGFCPQFKFQIGETFGRTTTRLLADPKVPKSGRTLLADIKPIKPGYPGHDGTAGYPSYLKERKASFGDQKFTEQMVPGYTGYIPKSQHFYGNRYAEICRDAVSQFEQDQQGERKKRENMKNIQRVQAGQIKASDVPEGASCRHTCPLRKLPGKDSTGRFNYIPKPMGLHSLSPYYMKDEDPQKSFMSGYTGFVPNARGLTGMGYPILTNRALITFTNDPNHPMTKQKLKPADKAPGPDGSLSLSPLPPVQRRARDDVLRRFLARQLPVIYPIESGLVPHYTGHIPGQKFRYGTTFGHSTRNAKREPNSKKKNGSS